MIQVSVIIPCYNHGIYIEQAIASVEQISDPDLYEIIIVNDGSTDAYTNEKMAELSQKGYHVIFQKNMGLAASRNNAIALARGKYILPLDADNKIRPDYVLKGIATFEANPEVSIVYGDAELFGEKEGVQKAGNYNLQRLLLNNYIDACAIFRKEVWEKTRGYDSAMQGLEDWEFWLHASFLGFRFAYVEEVLFDYQVLANSMVRELNKSKIKNSQNIEYMAQKHPTYFGPQFVDKNIMDKFGKSPAGFVGRLILKRYFPRAFARKVASGALRKYI